MSSVVRPIWRLRSRGIIYAGLEYRTQVRPLKSTVGLSKLLARFQSTTASSKKTTSLQWLETTQDQLTSPSTPAEVSQTQLFARRTPRVRRKGQAKSGSNYNRNYQYRGAFLRDPDLIEKTKKQNLAYVPQPRVYLSEEMTAQSYERTNTIVNTIAAHNKLRNSPDGTPAFLRTLSLLEGATALQSEEPISAIRVELPKTLTFEGETSNLSYVESATGLLATLRTSPDNKNPSAIVIRGPTSAIVNAADELVKELGRDIQVARLGEVTDLDYQTTYMWPAIKGAPQDGSTVPAPLTVHKEPEPRWIDEPYENLQKPLEWTQESFEDYVTKLVFCRLRPESATKFYEKGCDTDGIRVALIIEAFRDSSARPILSPHMLRLATEFMAQRGGHRAAARRLLSDAEQWGVPLDTDMFNLILEGHVERRDIIAFHITLRKMRDNLFRPNPKTWLLFLRLVEDEQSRGQVIIRMYEQGFLQDPSILRAIAPIMAAWHAHSSFRARQTVERFYAEQVERYGKDWFTADCFGPILHELVRLRSDKEERYQDVAKVLKWKSADGRSIDAKTLNSILRFAASELDWKLALLALQQFPDKGYLVTDKTTYFHVCRLAIRAHARHALGVAIFYGLLEHKLGFLWEELNDIFRGKHRDTFWRTNLPYIFSSEMAERLYYGARVYETTQSAQRAIMATLEGYEPVPQLSESLYDAWLLEEQRDQLVRLSGRESTELDAASKMDILVADPAGLLPSKRVTLDSCPRINYGALAAVQEVERETILRKELLRKERRMALRRGARDHYVDQIILQSPNELSLRRGEADVDLVNGNLAVDPFTTRKPPRSLGWLQEEPVEWQVSDGEERTQSSETPTQGPDETESPSPDSGFLEWLWVKEPHAKRQAFDDVKRTRFSAPPVQHPDRMESPLSFFTGGPQQETSGKSRFFESDTRQIDVSQGSASVANHQGEAPLEQGKFQELHDEQAKAPHGAVLPTPNMQERSRKTRFSEPAAQPSEISQDWVSLPSRQEEAPIEESRRAEPDDEQSYSDKPAQDAAQLKPPKQERSRKSRFSDPEAYQSDPLEDSASLANHQREALIEERRPAEPSDEQAQSEQATDWLLPPKPPTATWETIKNIRELSISRRSPFEPTTSQTSRASRVERHRRRSRFAMDENLASPSESSTSSQRVEPTSAASESKGPGKKNPQDLEPCTVM